MLGARGTAPAERHPPPPPSRAHTPVHCGHRSLRTWPSNCALQSRRTRLMPLERRVLV